MRLWQVDSSCLGVESLTKRLVSLLTVRIKDALPNMKWELQESLSECPLFSPFLPPYLGRPAWAVLLGPCERTTPRTEQNRTEQNRTIAWVPAFFDTCWINLFLCAIV